MFHSSFPSDMFLPFIFPSQRSNLELQRTEREVNGRETALPAEKNSGLTHACVVRALSPLFRSRRRTQIVRRSFSGRPPSLAARSGRTGHSIALSPSLPLRLPWHASDICLTYVTWPPTDRPNASLGTNSRHSIERSSVHVRPRPSFRRFLVPCRVVLAPSFSAASR